MTGLFRKYDFEVSHLNHLAPKTTSLRISKMCSTLFLPQKLTEILKICPDFSSLKLDHILESLLDFKSFYDALYVGNQRRYSSGI